MPQHLSIRVPWHDHGWDGTVCAVSIVLEPDLYVLQGRPDRDLHHQRD